MKDRFYPQISQITQVLKLSNIEDKTFVYFSLICVICG